MRCPACSYDLVPMTVQGMTLDVCRDGCGGIWFDQFELKKFDEQAEEAAELLQLEPAAGVAVDAEAKRPCPKCANLILMKHYTSPRREVRIDTCPGCGGQWLDHGELAGMRAEFATEADRRQAARDFAERTLPLPATPAPAPRGFMARVLGALGR